MLEISNFLEKFLKLDENNSLKRIAVLKIIKKETGVELKKENIKIEREKIKVKSNPIIRNQIFMYKYKIEEVLKSQKIFLEII